MSDETIEYAADGQRDELFDLLTRFSLFEITTDKYIFGNAPDAWSVEVDEAVNAKRQGEYLRSAQILTALMQDSGTAYTGLTDVLLEIELCSGFITAGMQRIIFMIDKLERANLSRLTMSYTDRLRGLARSFGSEEALRSHLSKLCGNSDYYLPDDFDGLKAQFEVMASDEMYREHFRFLTHDRGAGLARALSGSNTNVRSSEDVVPLIMNDDGSLTFSAHEAVPFNPDFKWKEVGELSTGLRHDSDDVTGKKLMRRSADKYPEAWEPQIKKAIDLKRRGKFLASAEIYEDLSRSSGILYTGIIASLYKSVVASGALLEASFLLSLGSRVFHNDRVAVANAAGQPSTFEDHMSRLIAALHSKDELENYLRDVDGNVNYRLPRDYENATEEFQQHYVRAVENIDKLTKAQNRGSGGCYIATAVYGSYDAPAVLTLRHFRDEKLEKSVAGRAFIRSYYLVSPAIANRLKSAKTLNRAVRHLLDRVVSRLES